jgi:cysteine desulfurase
VRSRVLRSDFFCVVIYLDNNATTQLDPAVLEEMLPFLREQYGNPSSGYQFGVRVRQAINVARERLAALLNCEPDEIVFTGSGTEANNAAINSAVEWAPGGKHLVTTAVEHSAVRRHCEELARRGCEVTIIDVDENGDVDLAQIEAAIRPNTAMVSAMWANNETGVLFPVEKIAEICREKRVPFHTDAVQVTGKLPISLRDSAIRFLSLSAHKFHGPKGVGALYVKRGTQFQPSIIGGGQEDGRRAGTENVASIVGLGKAAERAAACMIEEQTRVRRMRDKFEQKIKTAIEEASISGADAERLPNTSNCSFAGIESSAALLLLDRHGVCCSAGSACRTGSHDASHVLTAMKVDPKRASGALRFSFGRYNTDRDPGTAADVLIGSIAKLRRLSGSLAPLGG